MHNPPHPGEAIRELCLDPLGLSVTAAAKALDVTRKALDVTRKALDVTRKALSELLNGHTGITPAMAMRLSLVFGGSAESWLMQQAQYDLWRMSKNPPKVRRLA